MRFARRVSERESEAEDSLVLAVAALESRGLAHVARDIRYGYRANETREGDEGSRTTTSEIGDANLAPH